ncbi:restriction endonuclease [Nocardioides sp. NPDC006303]|uniref:restriction endonuclease n=1 Tax=Nocardioides sp. NPDC006303 TaxID=3156747 RepID=UPI0033B2E13C
MKSKPEPQQIDSWKAAEENAARWMRYWGFTDSRCTPAGPDGGIDVVAGSALAQVKFEAHQTGAPAVQRLVGARRNETEKALLFFSGVGFARPAVEYADDMGIALFKYDLLGEMSPQNLTARQLVADAERDQRVVDDHAQARPSTSEGTASTGWFARHWWILVAAFFGQQAIRNFAGVSNGTAPEGIDWYDPVISAAVAVGFLAVWLVRTRRRANGTAERVAAERAEARVERNAQLKAGLPSPWDLPAVVVQLEARNKLGAIKAYREATKVGLAEAKAAVESA